MITSLIISNVASYVNPVSIQPKKINYIYGGNGTGKTTLSKVISDNRKFQHCIVSLSDQDIGRLVYNRDFIKNNFSQNTKIPSIFTLGEESHTRQLRLQAHERA